MPTAPAQSQRPEQGFTSLSNYLDANQGTLAAGFGQAQADTSAFRNQGQPTAGAPGVQDAKNLSAQFGSEAALAGSGRLGQGAPGAFNAGLSWAKNGQGYQGLSQYLGQWSPAPPPAMQIDPSQSGGRNVQGPEQQAPAAPGAQPGSFEGTSTSGWKGPGPAPGTQPGSFEGPNGSGWKAPAQQAHNPWDYGSGQNPYSGPAYSGQPAKPPEPQKPATTKPDDEIKRR